MKFYKNGIILKILSKRINDIYKIHDYLNKIMIKWLIIITDATKSPIEKRQFIESWIDGHCIITDFDSG